MTLNNLILCHPLLLLPSIFPSIEVFFNEWALCIRWLKYWSFSFSISPFSEYSGLISFSIDWFDLLALQRILKSLPRTTIWKHLFFASKAFFMVLLSHLSMTTGKTIALTIWTFVSKVISLLCNMLSMLVIAFLPRSQCLLISRVQSPAMVTWYNIIWSFKHMTERILYGLNLIAPYSFRMKSRLQTTEYISVRTVHSLASTFLSTFISTHEAKFKYRLLSGASLTCFFSTLTLLAAGDRKSVV